MKKPWYAYLWIFSVIYLLLGFFSILFAWLGLLCFMIPLLIALFGGQKAYCNRYCGRGQLFHLLGARFGLSRRRDMPAFLRSRIFRYAFLAFFMTMFILMLVGTYGVFAGTRSLREAVTLLWSIPIPWAFANNSSAPLAPWILQFAYGFYSIMLTSTVLGLLTMLLYKPRSWCVYCPMGTMTQLICQAKYHSCSVRNDPSCIPPAEEIKTDNKKA